MRTTTFVLILLGPVGAALVAINEASVYASIGVMIGMPVIGLAYESAATWLYIQQNPETPLDALEEANIYYSFGSYARAEAVVMAGLEKEPDRQDLHDALAALRTKGPLPSSLMERQLLLF